MPEKSAGMNPRQELMSFRYRALFQSLDIRFFKTTKQESFTIHCEAEIKLPMIKKSYKTASEFKTNFEEWLKHAPVHEMNASENWLQRNKENEHAQDPVGFFMMFNQGIWSASSVNLLIGAKVVKLAVKNIENGFEISRPEKDQKLRVITSTRGIEKLEVPLPLIGAVSVDRVW